jgi:biopolymer transport protein TolR
MPRQKRHRQLAEINVVPYIDVMLVLLVIFMITAPLLFQGVNVNLPTANAKPVDSKPPEPIILSIDNNGNYYLNISPQPSKIITPQDLFNQVAFKLKQSQETNQRQILIKGDKSVDYGKIMQAMVTLQNAGAQTIGLITKPDDAKTNH